MNGYLEAAVEAAKLGGAFLKNNLGKIKKVSYKGKINLVTDIDKKSEKLILKFLKSRYPGHGVLSEETPPAQTQSSYNPLGYNPLGYRWIVDPLDGTTNYAHGFPFFCVSVALEKDGEIIAGAVYEPMRDELFYAQKGKGAFLNKRAIRVSKVRTLNRALLATGFSYKIREDRSNLVHFENFLMRAQAVRRAGSAALDLCYVACGRFDGFWEMDLKPWDTAAGTLIVREANGLVSDFAGGKYSIYGNQILAANGRIQKPMVGVLKSLPFES